VPIRDAFEREAPLIPSLRPMQIARMFRFKSDRSYNHAKVWKLMEPELREQDLRIQKDFGRVSTLHTGGTTTAGAQFAPDWRKTCHEKVSLRLLCPRLRRSLGRSGLRDRPRYAVRGYS